VGEFLRLTGEGKEEQGFIGKSLACPRLGDRFLYFQITEKLLFIGNKFARLFGSVHRRGGAVG
jgi:hypothetical protein